MFKSVVFLVLVFNKRDYAAADRFWSLQGPGAMWSVGASAMMTLFDGGRRRVFNDEAKASYDSTVASYRETVLTGFQQVEDNLAALRILEQEAGVQAPAVQDA